MPIKGLSPAGSSARTGQFTPRYAIFELLRNPAGRSSAPPRIRTSRLILRPWVRRDRPAFARMNANPRVMKFSPGLMSRAQSDAALDLMQLQIADHGWGIWALEIPGETCFAGCIGLSRPRFQAHFTPCVELSWRLDEPFWGRAYATEGARAVLAFGFGSLGLREIVSHAPEANVRALGVMERIGMDWNADDDFDHPALSEGDPLRRHLLYRMAAY